MKNVRKYTLLFTVLLLAIVAFYPGLFGKFLLTWDDDNNVVKNVTVHQLNWATVKSAFFSAHLAVWEPLSVMLKAVIIELFGMKPFPFKVVSLILHLLNILILAHIFKKLLALACRKAPDESDSSFQWALFFGLLIFALHPMRVANVTWVSGQPYLLCAFFYFLSVLAYIKYSARRDTAKKFHGWLWLSFILFILASWSKGAAMSLPFILVLLDIYPLKRLSLPRSKASLIQWLRSIVEKIPFFLYDIFLAKLALISKRADSTVGVIAFSNFFKPILVAAYGYVFYIVKTIIPVNLSPYYPMPGSLYMPSVRASSLLSFYPYVLALIALIIAAILLLLFRKKLPGLLVAVCAYGIILAPNIGLVQSGPQLVADRYAYIGIIPILSALSYGLYRLLKLIPVKSIWNTIIRYGTTALIVAGLLSTTWNMELYWKSSIAFWKRVVKIHSECGEGYIAIGEEYGKLGDKTHHKAPYEIAEAYFNRGLEVGVTDYTAFYKRGLVRVELGKYEGAREDLTEFLYYDPYHFDVLYHLGNLELRARNLDKAKEYYNRIMALDSAKAIKYDIPARLKLIESR